MTPRAVIFDIDGTMVDNDHHHEEAWWVLFGEHGIEIDQNDFRSRFHARPNSYIIAELFPELRTVEARRELGRRKEEIYRELHNPKVSVRPGLFEFLAELESRNIPMAAASNGPRLNVEFVLNGLGIYHRFRSVLSVDDVARGKPDPMLFLNSAERLGVVPANCVVFEDSESGFQAAKAAGMRYIALTKDIKDFYQAVTLFRELE